MKEWDYELRMQSLVEMVSSHKSGDGLELHYAVAEGQLEHVKFDDSGIGPSTFTDTKSTTVFEVSGYLPI